MGAWWPSRSSKPPSDRLRAEERSIRSLSAILNVECRMWNPVGEIPHAFRIRRKGVLLMSREPILKLTSLSSCAG